MCTSYGAAVPDGDVGDDPAIGAVESAVRQHNYYY
jgi:hypothetical protein